MRKTSITLLIGMTVAVALLSVAAPGHTQSARSAELDRLQRQASGTVDLVWNTQTDTPSFIRGAITAASLNSLSDDPVALAWAFVEQYKVLLGIGSPADELRVDDVTTDVLGMRHVTMHQVYQGADVFNAGIRLSISADGQQVVAASNSFVPGLSLSLPPAPISAATAKDSALLASPTAALIGTPILVVYPRQISAPAGSDRLAWIVDLEDRLSLIQRRVVVDAGDGSLLDLRERGDDWPQAIPDSQATNTLDTTASFKPLILPFADGAGTIINGYQDGEHSGGDEFALDLCAGTGCSVSYVNQEIRAPTDMTYVYSVSVNGDLNNHGGDYHFFEITADDNGKRLCMSLGHFYKDADVFADGKVEQGEVLGHLAPWNSPPHYHIGLWHMPQSLGCAGDKASRVGQPFVGPYALDDVEYPDLEGVDDYEDTALTANNTCAAGSYNVQYYTGTNLSDSPVLAQCEDSIALGDQPGTISYDWGTGKPIRNISADNFSIRWAGWFTFNAENYTFFTRSDDGVRLWVDDALLIDQWRDQPATEYSADITLTAGLHKVKVEYYERTSSASLEVRWWSNDSDPDDQELSHSVRLSGAITPVGDSDTFTFHATAGQRLQVLMQAVSAALNPYLTLSAADGTLIAEDDNSGGGTSALIVHEFTADGDYRIVASSKSAAAGAYTLTVNLLSQGLYREIYNGRHTTSLPGYLVRIENQTPVSDQEVNDAYDFTGNTYNYFLQTHNRNSYDDQGAPLLSTVHYGRAYQNAGWSSLNQQMIYGDGFAVKDVTAHEVTHAVTSNTANLEYRWQSGALNESFSDIFGAMVDREDWLIGEDLPESFLAGRAALRDMADPARFGDAGSTSEWNETCGDNEGVHSNSGIFNKAYYNIATAVDKAKAEQIFYRVLTVYLHPTSSLEDARAAALQATGDLYPSDQNLLAAVTAGFDAVGLDGKWNPPTNSCSCAATAALNDSTTYPDRFAALQVAATLYRVRSELLNTSAVGRHYRELYEQHSGRATQLLIANPQLRAEAAQILSTYAPGLGLLIDRSSEQPRITTAMINDLTHFLQHLADADRAGGGGALAEASQSTLTQIDLQRLVGMTYAQAWAYVESHTQSTNSVYLPLLMR